MTKREQFEALWVPLEKREPSCEKDQMQLVLVYIPPNPWPHVMFAAGLAKQIYACGAKSPEGVMWMYYYGPQGTPTVAEFEKERAGECSKRLR